MQSPAPFTALADALVNTAKDLLAKQSGEFHPFAAFVNPAGGVETLGVEPGDAKPTPTQLTEFLRIALRKKAAEGSIVGAGVCVNVDVHLPGYYGNVDAICCFLEYAGIEPIDLYVPFRKGEGGWIYDEPVGLPGKVIVFPVPA